jgi:hypothetical protein
MGIQEQILLHFLAFVRVVLSIVIAMGLYKVLDRHKAFFGDFDTIRELKERNYAVAAVVCVLLYCLFRAF